MKQERKSNPYFGVEISRSKYKNGYDRDIELSISTNGSLDRIAKYEYPGPERTTKIYKKIY